MIVDHFGFTGCSMGDVNGTGISEIAVCAMNPYGNGQGAVQIFLGRDGQSLQFITKNSLQKP